MIMNEKKFGFFMSFYIFQINISVITNLQGFHEVFILFFFKLQVFEKLIDLVFQRIVVDGINLTIYDNKRFI